MIIKAMQSHVIVKSSTNVILQQFTRLIINNGGKVAQNEP